MKAEKTNRIGDLTSATTIWSLVTRGWLEEAACTRYQEQASFSIRSNLDGG